MLTKGTEPKQALGNETNPGDEKWLEQEERKTSLEWKEQLEQQKVKIRLKWEKQLGEEEQLEWEKLDEREKLEEWLEERKWHQEDNECNLIRECFSTRSVDTLIDSAKGLCTTNLMHAWFCDESDLTENQKKFNKKLLNILSGSPDTGGRGSYSYSSKVHRFLEGNKDDLKTVLNLKRGESGLTVLHAVVSMAAEHGGRLAEEYVSAACSLIEAGANPNAQNDREQTPLHYAAIGSSGDGIVYLIEAGADPNVQDVEGKTPLHYSAGLGHDRGIESLLQKKAKCDVLDKTRKTPLQVAIDNHQYHVKRHFPDDNQKRLDEELRGIIYGCSHINDNWGENEDDNLIAKTVKNLKEFLDKHEGDQDLKVVLNFHNEEGRSIVLQGARGIFSFSKAAAEVEDLLLKAGATDLGELDYNRKKCLPKSRTLWDNLIPEQQKKLSEFFDKVHRAQDMKQLEEVVDQAIRSGVRFNFLIRPGKVAYQDAYSFTDHVMEKISALKESSEIANDIEVTSGIICKLVSKGAVLRDFSRLGSGFENHKTNIKRAHKEYVNNTLKFMKIVKSAATGRVKNAKMDNSTFYLEYSEDSTINVAKITDGARDLGLVQGETKYGRDIIRIGKSEVEIITQKGIRHYTDLADGSDIVLTFPTIQGELEVRLYPDKQNEGRIRVEVNNQDLLEQLKNCGEKLGENCLLGGYSVYNAIEHGYFERSEKPSQSPSTSKTLAEKVQESRRNQHESISL